jgi:hypothetical protein
MSDVTLGPRQANTPTTQTSRKSMARNAVGPHLALLLRSRRWHCCTLFAPQRLARRRDEGKKGDRPATGARPRICLLQGTHRAASTRPAAFMPGSTGLKKKGLRAKSSRPKRDGKRNLHFTITAPGRHTLKQSLDPLVEPRSSVEGTAVRYEKHEPVNACSPTRFKSWSPEHGLELRGPDK